MAINAREIEMGILCGVAVSGKMFAARDYPGISRALDPCCPEFGDLLRIRSKRALADDRVLRI